MYIQWCIKGIGGRDPTEDGTLPTRDEALAMVTSGSGIISNWWRQNDPISPSDVVQVLTAHNLDRHLHDYDNFGQQTPFISLACGSVERDAYARRNYIWSAIDTALMFATDDWERPGALYYCWVPTTMNPAVEVSCVAEPVGELNIYQRWSPYQTEGEVTAKVHVPSNQIQFVQWWSPSHSRTEPEHVHVNAGFVKPDALLNIRPLF